MTADAARASAGPSAERVEPTQPAQPAQRTQPTQRVEPARSGSPTSGRAAAYLASSTLLRLASAGVLVALPILAVQELDDIALGGALVAASLGPAILAAPLAGALLDRTRHPRAWVLIGGLVTAAAFGLAAGLGLLPTPMIAVALVAAGAATPFFMGGLSSFVTGEIRDDRRAYATDAFSYSVAGVAGPGLVSLAVTVGSARTAVIVAAVAALAGAVAALGLRLSPRGAPAERISRSIRRGASHLVRHRPIAVVTASATLSQFGQGALPIAAVALALERTRDADAAAWIVTAFAIGGLLGALVSTVRPPRRVPPEWTMGVGFAATGLLTLGAVAGFGIAGAVIAVGLSGLATAPSNAAMLLLRQQQSPEAVRSQVFTVGSGLRATASAAGAGVAGLAAGVPAGVLIGAVGAVWLLSAALMLTYPRGTRPVGG